MRRQVQSQGASVSCASQKRTVGLTAAPRGSQHSLRYQVSGAGLSYGVQLQKRGTQHQVLHVTVVDQDSATVCEVDQGL